MLQVEVLSACVCVRVCVHMCAHVCMCVRVCVCALKQFIIGVYNPYGGGDWVGEIRVCWTDHEQLCKCQLIGLEELCQCEFGVGKQSKLCVCAHACVLGRWNGNQIGLFHYKHRPIPVL